MKKYVKKKSPKSGPNAAGPKYRTPVHFRENQSVQASKFSGNKTIKPKFSTKVNPAQFSQVRHKS
jgi:hypothetical protein